MISLREATLDDCSFVFELSNDSLVRSASFSSEKIIWSEHQLWFDGILTNDDIQLWIVQENFKNIGQLRFKKISIDCARISISIVAEMRGQGLASNIIHAGAEKMFKETKFKKIEALIKKTNTASIKSFEKAGFLMATEQDDLIKLELLRSE
ncbi:MAG: GNAT family N-acetyltransferase [Lentisphaeraceae bacterium]|nr:GNAT family N-acetyltransferase [Lentisphaeraceae bacterium]